MMLLGVWLVNAIFTQKFTSFSEVTLNTDTAGLNLPARADVKVRGEIIGQVTEAESSPDGAVLTLGIQPDKIGAIPENVTASILPKTLFGEKYVNLVIPDEPSSTALKSGDTIQKTQLPVEVEKILNDLYPLLRAVQPAEINYTLNALATALEGRGDAIGNNLEVLDGYLQRMNPQMPKLIADLKLLGTVSDTYADVFPDIAATLRNSVKTGNTLLEKEETLNAFLNDVTLVLRHRQRVPRRERRQPGPARPGVGAAAGAARPLLAGVPVPARRHRAPGAAPGRHVPRLRLPHQPAHDPEAAAGLHAGRLAEVRRRPTRPTAGRCPPRRTARSTRSPRCPTSPTASARAATTSSGSRPSFDRAAVTGTPPDKALISVADGAGARRPRRPGGRPRHADVRSAWRAGRR